MRLEGKVVVISGGGGDIGGTAARLFAHNGARVVVTDIDADAGGRVVGDICSAGGDATFLPMDVTDPDSVAAAMRGAAEHYGGLDVLYNNAGGSSRADASVVDAPIEDFWRTIQRNLFGTWLCCKFGIPELVRRGGGSVINMASIAALIGHSGLDAYTAAKGGILSLTRSMAVEFSPQRVRVNALTPGATKTRVVTRLVDAGMLPKSLISRHLLGLLQPQQIADAALFLASDESSGMTGQTVVIDSGATATALNTDALAPPITH